jgi:uncharacterized protein (DUF1800 family)
MLCVTTIVNAKLDTSTDPQVGFRPPGALDAATALAPFRGPFNARHAAHLLRRAGFGGTRNEVAAFAQLDAQRAVDMLFHPVDADVAFPEYPPELGTLDNTKYGQRKTAVQLWWLDRMLRSKRQLVEKMTLYWHNYFATAVSKSPPEMMAQQNALFRAQGLGNFRTLLASVTRDPAMLVWLDNRYNAKAHPNENYAREVMELFTLGLGNYTEDDVKEGARAFTGWTLKNGQPLFNPALHDPGLKTFLGHTGSFDADDAISIIVSQPIHQRFFAHKLLEAFVYSDPEPELIEAVASVYALSGYDISRTLAAVLRSNVFFSTRAYRAIPKSPVEFAVGTLRYIGATAVPANLPGVLARMGQEPLNPPSVKGWDGGPSWINTSTMLARFNFVNTLIATTAPPKPAPATAKPPAMTAATTPATNAPNVQPDELVHDAGGFNAPRIVELLVSGALQDDVTGDVRGTLVDYLTGTGGPPQAGNTNPLPFGPENYQEKIRGVVALTLNLPVNQLN